MFCSTSFCLILVLECDDLHGFRWRNGSSWSCDSFNSHPVLPPPSLCKLWKDWFSMCTRRIVLVEGRSGVLGQLCMGSWRRNIDYVLRVWLSTFQLKFLLFSSPPPCQAKRLYWSTCGSRTWRRLKKKDLRSTGLTPLFEPLIWTWLLDRSTD